MMIYTRENAGKNIEANMYVKSPSRTINSKIEEGCKNDVQVMILKASKSVKLYSKRLCIIDRKKKQHRLSLC